MAGGLPDKYEQCHAKDRRTWRNWLQKNHASAAGILLVYDKKGTGADRLDYEAAVEEALCFGWIDSTQYSIDADRYAQLFTPRKPRSNWVKSNRERVERLVAQGLMTPAGLAKVEAAKKDGSWNQLDDVEKLVVPPELKKALSAKKGALAKFDSLAPSKRKQLLYWLWSAKRPETRAQRISGIIAAVQSGKMPFG